MSSNQVRRLPMTRRRAAELTAALTGSKQVLFDPMNNIDTNNNTDVATADARTSHHHHRDHLLTATSFAGAPSSSTSGATATTLSSSSSATATAIHNDSSHYHTAGSPSGSGGVSLMSSHYHTGAAGNHHHGSRPLIVASKNAPFRCICSRPAAAVDANGMYGLDTAQCRKCHSVLHASCVGLTRPELLTSKLEQRAAEISISTFVCPLCLLQRDGDRVGDVRLRAGSWVVRDPLSGGGVTTTATQHDSSANNKSSSGAGASKRPDRTARSAMMHNHSSAVAAAAAEPFIAETPDAPPDSATASNIQRCIASATASLKQAGFRVILFPQETLTKEMEEQIMACCASSIENATFSEAYPRWCISELQSKAHPYLQGAAAQDVESKKIVAVVFSNGRDPYCDLKRTVQHLKAQITRGQVRREVVAAAAAADTNNNNKNSGDDHKKKKKGQHHQQDANEVSVPKFMNVVVTANTNNNRNQLPQRRQRGGGNSKNNNNNQQQQQQHHQSLEGTDDAYMLPESNVLVLRGTLLENVLHILQFGSFDSVVHFTFVVTHDEFRGRRLASTLMWIELARWALRGRKVACVNMALEKIYGTATDDSDKNNKVNRNKKKVHDVDDLTSSSGSDDDADAEHSGSSQDDDDDDDADGEDGRAQHHTKNKNRKKTVNDNNNNNKTKKKKKTSSKSEFECRISEASRRLYSSLNFFEVFPRYHADGTLRWTKKEEEAGRMMVSHSDYPSVSFDPKNPKCCPFLK